MGEGLFSVLLRHLQLANQCLDMCLHYGWADPKAAEQCLKVAG